MAESFLPILLLMVVAAGIAGVILLLSSVLGPNRPTREKLGTYESGVPLVDASRKRLSIRFFLVAMVFILFDVEIAFLYPWAVAYAGLGLSGLVQMVIFIVILMVGFFYAWDNGALEWS